MNSYIFDPAYTMPRDIIFSSSRADERRTFARVEKWVVGVDRAASRSTPAPRANGSVTHPESDSDELLDDDVSRQPIKYTTGSPVEERLSFRRRGLSVLSCSEIGSAWRTIRMTRLQISPNHRPVTKFIFYNTWQNEWYLIRIFLPRHVRQYSWGMRQLDPFSSDRWEIDILDIWYMTIL